MITLRNQKTNKTVEMNEGVSIPFLFFGPVYIAIKGHLVTALHLGLKNVVTFGLAHFYYAFKINSVLVQLKLAQGYTPATEEDAKKVEALNIGYTLTRYENFSNAA